MQESKAAVLAAIRGVREGHINAIQGVDPHLVVHPDSGWTLKDLIAHITLWEADLVQALKALKAGQPYQTPGLENFDFDGFNQRGYEAARDASWDVIIGRWYSTRADLEWAVNSLDEATWAAEMRSPYGSGRTNPVASYVRFICEQHENEHFEEIFAAKRRSRTSRSE